MGQIISGPRQLQFRRLSEIPSWTENQQIPRQVTTAWHVRKSRIQGQFGLRLSRNDTDRLKTFSFGPPGVPGPPRAQNNENRRFRPRGHRNPPEIYRAHPGKGCPYVPIYPFRKPQDYYLLPNKKDLGLVQETCVRGLCMHKGALRRWLCNGGRGHKDPAGASWYQLEPAGTSWCQLGPAGTSWYQLGPAGPSWDQLGPAGTSWHQLGPAGTQRVPAGTQLVPAGTQLVPAGTSWYQFCLLYTSPSPRDS